MKKILILFIIIILLLVGGYFLLFQSNHSEEDIVNSSASLEEVSAQLELGKALYYTHCASCHGDNLQGQPKWKTSLDEDGHNYAPPLNGTGHTWHHPDQTLHQIIKYGLAKLVKNYKGKMIGFEKNLSDREIDYILGYIKSYWSDEYYNHQISMSIK